MESGYLDEIARRLDDEKPEYDQEPRLEGLQPEFIVYGPGNSSTVIGIRAWKSHPGYVARASDQAQLYHSATEGRLLYLQAHYRIGEMDITAPSLRSSKIG